MPFLVKNDLRSVIRFWLAQLIHEGNEQREPPDTTDAAVIRVHACAAEQKTLVTAASLSTEL